MLVNVRWLIGEQEGQMTRAKDKKKRLTLITTLTNVQHRDKTWQQKTEDKKRKDKNKRQEEKANHNNHPNPTRQTRQDEKPRVKTKANYI